MLSHEMLAWLSWLPQVPSGGHCQLMRLWPKHFLVVGTILILLPLAESKDPKGSPARPRQGERKGPREYKAGMQKTHPCSFFTNPTPPPLHTPRLTLEV